VSKIIQESPHGFKSEALLAKHFWLPHSPDFSSNEDANFRHFKGKVTSIKSLSKEDSEANTFKT